MVLTRNKEYSKIARRLIRTNPDLFYIKLNDVKWVILSSDQEKRKNRKTVFGECMKVDEKYKWCCKYDFMIIIYDQNCAHFSDKQKEILIEHELRHIGVDEEDGFETKLYIVPHDYEEFRSIIEAYGLDWSEIGAAR